MSSVLSTHYSLVYDEAQVKQFYELFAAPLLVKSETTLRNDEKETTTNVPLLQDRVMVFLLLAREKYLRHNDNTTTIRFTENNLHLPRTLISRYDPEEFLKLLKRYEVPFGCYTYEDEKKQAHPLPNESLVIYFDLQVKSTLQAFNKLSKSIQDNLAALVQEVAPTETSYNLCRIQSDLLSQIHASNATALNVPQYLDLDVDTKDRTILQSFVQAVWCSIEQAIRVIIETHGGFHIVLNKSEMKSAHNKCLHDFLRDPRMKLIAVNCNGQPCTKTHISLVKNPMVPLPGTKQGGFPVKMWTASDFLTLYC